jgi:hypothetical protein
MPYDYYAWGDRSLYLPGVAFKFFRNNTHSANIHTMHSFKGTTTPNFFQNHFSNHIKEDTDVWLKFLATKFAYPSPYVMTVGLRDFATYNQDGYED